VTAPALVEDAEGVLPTLYDPPMESDETNVAGAAELLGVSEDTVRALIRAETLPATQQRARGGYTVKRADVERVKRDRAAGVLAGPVNIDPAELAALAADEREARDLRKRTTAAEKRRNDRARAIRAASGQGYGAVTAMADALGLHRTTVQRWLKGSATADDDED
jgi:excisionase family DNA binding protein